MVFQFVQLVFWSALSAWFGSAVFLILAAPTILRSVRENNPILTDVLSVNLEGQHSTLLAGSIIGRLLTRLLRLEMICAGLLLVVLAVQPFVIDLSRGGGGMLLVRAFLFLCVVGVAFADSQYVIPKIHRNREEYVAHADEPEVANPALDRFDAAGRQSLALLFARVGLLLGVILFSAATTPKPTYLSLTSSAATP